MKGILYFVVTVLTMLCTCCNRGLAQIPYGGGLAKYANAAQYNGYTTNHNWFRQQQPVYTDSTAMLHSMLRLKTMESALPGILSADYYSACMGFFCKKEWQLEKATKIPVRLRLGSLNYCDKLEGK